LKFYRQVRQNLIQDRSFRKYFEGESQLLPGGGNGREIFLSA